MENTNIIESAGITGDNVTSFTYAGFVNLKAKPGQDILANLDPIKCHLLHMAIGVSGEVGEFVNATSEENALEELGDIEFFLQGMSINGTGVGVVDYQRKFIGRPDWGFDSVLALTVLSAELLDVFKKYAIYNKPLNVASANKLWYEIHNALDQSYAKYGTNRQQVIADNVDKLNKRYVRGYSDTEAQVRADKIGE